jgi:hypothetical protein
VADSSVDHLKVFTNEDAAGGKIEGIDLAYTRFARVIMCMLLIVALLIIWQVFGAAWR